MSLSSHLGCQGGPSAPQAHPTIQQENEGKLFSCSRNSNRLENQEISLFGHFILLVLLAPILILYCDQKYGMATLSQMENQPSNLEPFFFSFFLKLGNGTDTILSSGWLQGPECQW